MSDVGAAAAKTLTGLLQLDTVGVSVTGARIVGRGSKASCDVYLSDQTEINFESLKDIAMPAHLSLEIAACTGAMPRLKMPQTLHVISLLRTLADHLEVSSADDFAIDWGVTYLQVADVVEVDLSDQAQRWDAFTRMQRSMARVSLVLRDTDGWRLVRTGWFRAHVQIEDHTVSPQEIANRMKRVGWVRPGKQGQIKASRPGFPGTLAFTFYRVPPDWQEIP